MGAAPGVFAKTTFGKPLSCVTPMEGHRIWAATYDAGPNPLLALETRLLLERLNPLRDSRFLDVACGTGRWMLLAQQRGCQVFGVDFCPEMLMEASRKPGLDGRLGLADARRIPLADGAADLTVCSFALGYLPSPHPGALAAGWTRSFRSDGQTYEIDHHLHPIATWVASAQSAALALDWVLEAPFAEPEREIFRQAGKDALFPELSRIPALLAMSWTKP
jgi:SAM-dependent methyltransferase